MCMKTMKDQQLLEKGCGLGAPNTYLADSACLNVPDLRQYYGHTDDWNLKYFYLK